MNVINFEDGRCKRIRSYLDSYLNSELMIETNHEVLMHLETCGECSRSLEDRARLKTQLKRAVMQDDAPAALRERIGSDLQRSRRAGVSTFSWSLAAAAAVLVIAAAIFFTAGPARDGLSLRAEVAPGDLTGRLLKVGFDNHVACTLDHRLANAQFTSEQMAEELGSQYAGLVSLVRENMPQAYTVVVGHRCHYQQRDFIHLIVRSQNDVVSLVITRKNGEGFPAAGAAVVQASGVRIHETSWHSIQVAGMETRDYLAFVISNKTLEGNEQVASSLAPAVNDFLRKIEA
jgi:anti-sigma factor RsiW